MQLYPNFLICVTSSNISQKDTGLLFGILLVLFWGFCLFVGLGFLEAQGLFAKKLYNFVSNFVWKMSPKI